MSLFDILGQKRVAEMLSKGLKNRRIAHAYVFAGSKGVGKSKMALEFAKALNCHTNTHDACDTCKSCTRIAHYNHQDVKWVKPDGYTIKIEQIRQLQKDSHYKSTESNYRVYIIEHAETMTQQAANSLLKFLEEPQSPTVVILLTENAHQLLSTIRSRCQMIHFSHIDPYHMVETLTIKGYEERDVLLAAHLTEDIDEVQALLESEQFANMRALVIKWSEDIESHHMQALYTIDEKILKNDYIKEYLPRFIDLLLLWYHDIFHMKWEKTEAIVYKGYEQVLNKQALYVADDELIRRIEEILHVKKQIAAYVNPQLALEQLVLSLWEG